MRLDSVRERKTVSIISHSAEEISGPATYPKARTGNPQRVASSCPAITGSSSSYEQEPGHDQDLAEFPGIR
jgi:hypothetical protein